MRCCLIQQRKITISPSSLHVYMPLTVDTCGFVCENGKSVIFHPNSSLINDLVWGFFNIFTLFSLINEVFHALTLILPVFRSALRCTVDSFKSLCCFFYVFLQNLLCFRNVDSYSLI